MTKPSASARRVLACAALALAFSAGAGAPARAQIHCFPNQTLSFPRIDLCAFPGRYQDSTLVVPFYCVGHFHGPLPDSIAPAARAVTVRFHRDRFAEARPDFGGYRIYRVTNQPDTANMVLIRRYSRSTGDERTWNFSVLDRSTLQFMCGTEVATDTIVSFVDPDSSGSYQKRCRFVDPSGNCISKGDSIMVLVAPPGPHDGFRTWYSITYEALNSRENTYEDLFVPDLTHCTNPSDPSTCANLNNKSANMVSVDVEPTPGPTANLEHVGVVPNPFRAGAAWDLPGANELHFINLPPHATIKIFSVAGDLIATLQHDDLVRDFERWDLKNGRGRDVASGIYIYRVESGSFTFQSRFIVIR